MDNSIILSVDKIKELGLIPDDRGRYFHQGNEVYVLDGDEVHIPLPDPEEAFERLKNNGQLTRFSELWF